MSRLRMWRLLLWSSVAAALLNRSVAQDCVGFQESLDLSKGSSTVTLEYTVELLDPEDTSDFPQGTLRARLTYEGQAWLAFGVSSTPGRMIGGQVIIGLPSEANGPDNPGKFNLGGKLPVQVTPFPELASSALANATIEQSAEKTILTFTKLLVEPDELPIDGNGVNPFMWAHGFSNILQVHSQKGAFNLNLRPCNVDASAQDDGADGFTDIELPDTYKSLFSAHGWLAGIAWGVLTPLAVAASLLRDFIPNDKWFPVHMALNLLTCAMTLASFGCAVAAQDKSTPAGESPNHFSAQVAHRTVGLVITILLALQVVGGLLRPHLPEPRPATDEEDGDDESTKELQKSSARIAWQLMHKLCGFALLGSAAWQVQEGLTLYANRFGEKDLTGVFWGVFGGILGIAVAGHAYSRFVGKE